MAESVSFTSSAGDQNSFRAVPSDRQWLLQTLLATNGEGSARDMEFRLVDADGLSYSSLGLDPLPRTNVPAGGRLAWHGQVLVPGGWTVRAYWYAMTGGSTCSWQYTALQD